MVARYTVYRWPVAKIS